jgi:hypothetical protein
MLSLLSIGVNHGYWLTFLATCESRGSKQEDVYNGEGMHKYLLCIIYWW